MENLNKAQPQDKKLLHFLNTDHSLKIKQVSVAETDLTLLYDESLSGKLRPFVSLGYRRTIFNNIHNLSQSRIKLTTRMVSETLTTDRGSQFLSQEWKEVMKFLGINHVHTAAYHPQSNGLAEKSIQTTKKAKNSYTRQRLVFLLPLTMLALRFKIKQGLDSSTCEIAVGSQLRLPGEIFKFTKPHSYLSSQFVSAQLKSGTAFPTERKTYVDPYLNQGKYVFITNDAVCSPLHPTYDGPFKVVQRTPKYF